MVKHRLSKGAQICGYSSSSLRTEARRGNLEILRVAGKDYVTEEAIRDMEKRCRIQAKAPALYLYKRKGYEPTYVIRDGSKTIRTGCTGQDVEGANQALAQYITESYRPDTKQRGLDQVFCADVMIYYYSELREGNTKVTKKYHIRALNKFWGSRSLAEVKGSTCKKYLTQRLESGVSAATRAPRVEVAASRYQLLSQGISARCRAASHLAACRSTTRKISREKRSRAHAAGMSKAQQEKK